MNRKHRSKNKAVTTKERRFWAKEIILPIVLALLASGGIIANWISRNDKLQLASLTRPTRIPLQDDYYHIGDVREAIIVENGKIIGVTPFSHPAPESNPFTKEFELPYLPKSATLFVTAKSIDTDEKNSAVKIFFNGIFFDYLNRYFTDETMEEKTIFIPVSQEFLREGNNTIQIFVESGTEGITKNIDDIEFRDLYLEISP